MYTNEDLKEMLDEDGFGFMIHHVVDTENIIDPTLRVLFEQLIRTAEEIKKRLEFAGI